MSDERNRYVILRPNTTSPYTLQGKLANPRRWTGPGPLFMIWDRQMHRWVDGGFVTRELAEEKLDELTNSRSVHSREERRAIEDGDR